ncbi:MAG TPA: hypothetical protein PKA41_13040 [Verrucomicrobiota bacterium]|nr:hypothetical protein [Verrucomicrobiota bacterium]
MKRDGKILLWICSGLAVALTSQAISDGSNPYERIVDRNVFSLKPPAPPPDNTPPPPPTPKIELQGITSFLGRRQVLFKAKINDKDQSFVLSEGQRDGEIEVLEINEGAGTVKFSNHGSVQTLDIYKDAVKTPSTVAAAPAAAGRPAPTMMGRPVTPAAGSGVSSTTSIGGAQQGLRSIPSRPTRTTPTSAGGGLSFSGTTGGTTTTQPTQPTFTPEEQTVIIEVERERTKAQVAAGELPPLPPTELTPPGSTGIPDEAIPPLPQ